MKKKFAAASVMIIISLFMSIFLVHPQVSIASRNQNSSYLHARPSTNGHLCVNGSQLSDQDGNPVILRGISTHGLTWFPEFISDEIFSEISNEWNCNLIRLPMYTDIYTGDNPEESLSLLKKGIDLAIANDMYVLVDWHILNDYDPNIHTDEAIAFFDMISSEYSDVPNLIYEICNEPNGPTTWNDVCNYSNQVIPVIRANCPDSVIVVGTPEYDRDLIGAVRHPLEFDNVMYVLHFYTATHYSDLQDELLEAIDRNLPVFISECGISEASGDGAIDYESAATWFNILRENGISYVVWSLSNKDESSAMLSSSYPADSVFTDNDLTPTGKWVKALIQGSDPSSIPIPAPSKAESPLVNSLEKTLTVRDWKILRAWPGRALFVLAMELILLVAYLAIKSASKRLRKAYDDIEAPGNTVNLTPKDKVLIVIRILVLPLSIFFTLMYLGWRIRFSVPYESGYLAVAANLILLVVEVFGFIESVILYINLILLKDHPLPEISEEEYPEVDIFIASYNEPAELLKKTINACNHLKYPDKSKVHVWLCDDNRRPEIRSLSKSMNIGYFDRPDNKGAKAGNLNNALRQTTAPYVVTLDADMIVKSDFLLKTIPYFVDAQKRNIKLGLLQTPQCFYEPDIFQYALYSEKSAPNEQDFFYRTIETAKTSTNSVIYGGSNTVISREALDAIGGFYTQSITEDFATGLLIESSGFVSLALSEPLASGKTPDTFKEHIKQRIRWGRGVISTTRQLHLFTRKGLSLEQRLSYWSSAVYWYSPVKNLIYILSPLIFAVFAIPVFNCSWLDLVLFWFPMYLMQDLCLRAYSKNAVSLKWSGIYETSIMPFLLKPIVLEFFGKTAKKFDVTDKGTGKKKRQLDLRSMMPFIVLIILSLIGIIRSLTLIKGLQSLGIIILLFWLIRNLYFLTMSIFLADGRDSHSDMSNVVDAEPVAVKSINNNELTLEGITTYLTEHSLKFYLDESDALGIGDKLKLCIDSDKACAVLDCVVTGISRPKSGFSAVYSVEILDFGDYENEYLQILYDRIPTLPQSLSRDYGIINHLLRNIAHRILR